ncbi:hypothetical protein KJ953_01865 [Patescibacteria group bacterium]|nr:hypothetical protein [Patescibacteria group bacterium]MBU1256778.1 hypothetical protein [Patescibacteria group bacterium]
MQENIQSEAPTLPTQPSLTSKSLWFFVSLITLLLAIIGVLAYQNYQLTQQLVENQSILSSLTIAPTSIPDPISPQSQNITESDDVVQESESEVVEQLVSEKAIGYIKRVYDKNGKRFLDIDYIQWLNSEECTAKKLSAPNGYCIENINTKIRSFEISQNVQIKVDTLSYTADGNFNFGESISYLPFKNLFAVDSNSSLKESLYWVVVKDSVITSISEQYRP